MEIGCWYLKQATICSKGMETEELVRESGSNQAAGVVDWIYSLQFGGSQSDGYRYGNELF